MFKILFMIFITGSLVFGSFAAFPLAVQVHNQSTYAIKNLSLNHANGKIVQSVPLVQGINLDIGQSSSTAEVTANGADNWRLDFTYSKAGSEEKKLEFFSHCPLTAANAKNKDEIIAIYIQDRGESNLPDKVQMVLATGLKCTFGLGR